MGAKTRIEEMDREALHAVEREHQALLPAGFGADAVGARFNDFNWLSLICGIFLSLLALLCLGFVVVCVLAVADELSYDQSELPNFVVIVIGLLIFLLIGLLVAGLGTFGITRCRTRLWFVSDGKTFFFRWKNLSRGKTLVFDRDDIDFADTIIDHHLFSHMNQPTLYLFMASGKVIPLYTPFSRMGRYKPYFDRIRESLDPGRGTGGERERPPSSRVCRISAPVLR